MFKVTVELSDRSTLTCSTNHSVSIPERFQWDFWDHIFSICSVSNRGHRHGVMAAWWFSSCCFAVESAWLDICELLTFIRPFRDIPNRAHPLA